MRVKVEVKIHPSEDAEKVLEAINNLFPTLDLELEDDKVVGESDKLESLENFKNKNEKKGFIIHLQNSFSGGILTTIS